MLKVCISRVRIAIATAHYSSGDDHRRVRGIMNAAFSPSSIRALPFMFADIAEKVFAFTFRVWSPLILVLQVAEKMEMMMSDADRSGVVDIYHTIHCATLDGVGEGTKPTVMIVLEYLILSQGLLVINSVHLTSPITNLL